ncbi:hypothetical protein FOBRF1_007167 [Fusarium oxysporum]
MEIKLHRHPPIERLRGTSARERSIEMMIENALNDGFTIGTKIRVRSWWHSPSQETQQEGLIFEDFDEVIDSRHGELVSRDAGNERFIVQIEETSGVGGVLANRDIRVEIIHHEEVKVNWFLTRMKS